MKPYNRLKKVINYIKEGHGQLEASTLFQLHKNTVNRWGSRYIKKGFYWPEQGLDLEAK